VLGHLVSRISRACGALLPRQGGRVAALGDKRTVDVYICPAGELPMRCATLAVRQFLALVEGVDHQDAGWAATRDASALIAAKRISRMGGLCGAWVRNAATTL